MTTFVPQFLYILLTVIGGAYSLDADADLVKRSNSGLCHPPNSRWHERTKHYDALDSLQACLESGGELPRGIKQTAHHSAHKPSDRRDYDRSAFGHGWGDTNGDCQDSRAEALISSSTTAVRFSSEQRCRVVSGRWISPFTNRVIQNASDVDIDHLVPLAWAWERGADGWTQVRREAFANDAVNLWPVEASLNRSISGIEKIS